MKNWEECNLEDCIKLIDYRGRTPVKTESGVRLITAKNVKLGYLQLEPQEFIAKENYDSWMSRGIPNYGDVIFTTEAPLANVAQIDTNEKLAFAQRIIVMQPNSKKIDHAFLKWMLLSENTRRRILEKGTGATVTGIKSSLLRKIRISFPPLPEQQRIVSILDECFAAIEKAKANAEQNLKNAQELFESYLEDLFTNLFQKTEKKTISELAKVIGGYSFKSTDFKKEGQYQVIRMGNVRPGIIRENESPVFINELEQKVLAKALLIPNDVIITQTGTKKKRDYGFTVIIEKENYLLNQRIASIRFSDKYLSKFFLYFSWTNIFKDQYFANESGTVGQGNVGIGAITDAKVPFITVKDQIVIVDKIEKLRIETQKLEAIYRQKLLNLEELKKSVLQKAFAGELKTEKALTIE